MRPRYRDERGSITFVLVGMTMVVLMLAGITIDIWRAVAAQRGLATAVDAAAAAGANGLDEAAYRRDGTVQLDPARAENLAAQSLAAQPEAPTLTASDVSATTERVTVRAEADVHLTLSRIFMSGGFAVSATADAAPEQS